MKPDYKVIDIFLPWVESIGLVIYCQLMVLFNLKFQPPLPVALLFFLPLAGFEFYLSRRYEGNRLFSRRGIIFLGLRMLFLLAIFYLWACSCLPVIRTPGGHLPFGRVAPTAQNLLPQTGLVVYARAKIFLLMLAILFLAYYIFFLRMRKSRFFISIILPWPLLFMLGFGFYTDIFGGVSRKKVESQPGVKIFFSYPVADFRTGRIFDRLHTFRYPRCLQIDEARKKLYLSFGSTYFDPSDFPNFLEVDLSPHQYPHTKAFGVGESIGSGDIETGNYPPPSAGYRAVRLQPRPYRVKAIRDFGFSPGGENLYLTCWNSEFKIYGISRNDFKVIEEIDLGHHQEIKHWEPYSILYNHKTETVYITNSGNPLLIAYHLRGNDDKVEIVDLTKEGLASRGSILERIIFSSALNKIYLLLDNILIVELETSPLKPTRKVKIPTGAMAIEIDEINKVILATSVITKELYEIDLASFKIIRKIQTPVLFCRKILIDNPNSLVYCLDYLRGKLFLIDRNTGKIYKKYWVGNKPLGMVKFGERIFVASNLGIIEIKPK